MTYLGFQKGGQIFTGHKCSHKGGPNQVFLFFTYGEKNCLLPKRVMVKWPPLIHHWGQVELFFTDIDYCDKWSNQAPYCLSKIKKRSSFHDSIFNRVNWSKKCSFIYFVRLLQGLRDLADWDKRLPSGPERDLPSRMMRLRGYCR